VKENRIERTGSAVVSGVDADAEGVVIQERAEGLEGRVGKYFECRSVRKEGEAGSSVGAEGAEGKWIGWAR